MAQLLDLPEEVFESSILPFLPWNDLLRFRRVCKTTKVITDDYIRLNPEQAPEIELTEQTGKNLKTFISLGIPTKKLFLNNPTGHQFFDNLDTATLSKFIVTYSPIITSLRLVEFSVFPCFNEWTFLEGLSNLKTFEAGHYGFGIVPSIDQRQQIEVGQFMRAMTDPRFKADFYPQNLMNIEILKIGFNKKFWLAKSFIQFGEILQKFLKLDYLSYPFCSDIEEKFSYLRPDYYLDQKREFFLNKLAEIKTSFVNKAKVSGQKNIKYVDFINYHDERDMRIESMDEIGPELSLKFLVFAAYCTRFGVKLLNVNPAWYHQRTNVPSLKLPIYGNPVVSLVNLHACIFPLDMPDLKSINICETSRSNVSPTWNGRPDWPALKTLEINVDSKNAVETDTPTQETALLFKFLWKDIVRGNLSELTLTFQHEKSMGGLAIPKTEDIVSACPNLRKLKIAKWPGTNKQLTKLWIGLPGLEELALEYCKNLGNVAFVGEDVNNPVFLRLGSLKKLTMKGLDQMPKISDTFFCLVLSKMKLSHLIIGSDKPLEKITKVGIIALLEGNFGETIEKFPFQGWSLANTSAKDFKRMSKRFRSFNML